jgi:DNA-binding MarR family transcriptional regulator
MTAVPPPQPQTTSDDLDPEISADLRRLLTAYRLLQMHHSRVLHHEGLERGLNTTDIRLVFFLAAAEGAGVTSKQAGEYLELTTGAMTGLIDRLEDRQHIERRRNPNDRRSSLLYLTESGWAIAREIGGIFATAFTESIDPQYFAPLASGFEQISTALK